MPPIRVYLVRHARAEASAGDDDARRLTPEGREGFAALVARLRARLAIRGVLASPLVRARETAGLLAAAARAPVEEDPRLAAGACGGAELLALARAAGDGAALVGHNPEVAEAVALAAGRGLEVRPGTIAAVDLGPASAALAWLEAP
ncbi:SixA phosphatase family protein [Anaeromyxobacter dehalogenans]|uniref:Putative phosphohistidine phosphatase, SixA n=1 Tax=Anaeromyxobacter dehalogenans (strain 2CP-C) TaxID=290397 RepID=Q2IMN5_ANADE|nr:phosphoglycerate mutase family protein [Anaeromyxobacter dehalogenans]ABC80068.1 putative phosphohistidine phosphatase, SixA [Anaeromyxobacter dehalogenans 2CP-C]